MSDWGEGKVGLLLKGLGTMKGQDSLAPVLAFETGDLLSKQANLIFSGGANPPLWPNPHPQRKSHLFLPMDKEVITIQRDKKEQGLPQLLPLTNPWHR